MAELTNLHDALVEEICDLDSAEKRLVKALPKRDEDAPAAIASGRTSSAGR